MVYLVMLRIPRQVEFNFVGFSILWTGLCYRLFVITQIKTSSQLREIASGFKMQLRDNSWNEFEKILNNIHSAFFKKLLDTCPDLSPTEIKIAALLKLNLSTKEIAAITFKSEAGIKSARFRLRQKLELTKDDSLVPFLMQL